jgi:hypothetical protein
MITITKRDVSGSLIEFTPHLTLDAYGLERNWLLIVGERRWLLLDSFDDGRTWWAWMPIEQRFVVLGIEENCFA